MHFDPGAAEPSPEPPGRRNFATWWNSQTGQRRLALILGFVGLVLAGIVAASLLGVDNRDDGPTISNDESREWRRICTALADGLELRGDEYVKSVNRCLIDFAKGDRD